MEYVSWVHGCGKLNGGWREVIIKWNEKAGFRLPSLEKKNLSVEAAQAKKRRDKL